MAMAKLRKSFPNAASYCEDLTENKTWLYKIIEDGYTTHGHKTSNIAEIMNNVLKEARNLDCYRLNDWIVKWWGRKVEERQLICKELKEKNSRYTPYAGELIGKEELKAREETMSVQGLGSGNYLVIRYLRASEQRRLSCARRERTRGRDGCLMKEERFTVNLSAKSCTCEFTKVDGRERRV